MVSDANTRWSEKSATERNEERRDSLESFSSSSSSSSSPSIDSSSTIRSAAAPELPSSEADPTP